MKGLSLYCLLTYLVLASCCGQSLTYSGPEARCRCASLSASGSWLANNVSKCRKVFRSKSIDNFATDEVVPDVIGKVPKFKLEVKFEDKDVLLGNELTPTEATEVPIQMSWPMKANALYTIIMVDPDVPNIPEGTQLVHWLVVNVKGCNIDAGELFVVYRGPGPPINTGLHRYVFLVYEQKEKLNLDIPFIPFEEVPARFGFVTKAFVRENRLRLVAGNYFWAQNEDNPK